MYEAYASTEIASKLEKAVEVVSLAADDHAAKVYVGSKAGHLLSLSNIHEEKREYELVMCRSFEKRAVAELEIVAHHGLILCLSDSQVSAHGISKPFPLKASINDIKPIITFCSYISEEDGILYIGVAARRRIYIYKWLLDGFVKIPLESQTASFSENVQRMVWCGNMIAFGVQNEYCTIGPLPPSENSVLELQKLFNIGTRNGDPIILNISDRELIGYCRDTFIYFQDYHGTGSSIPKVKLSEPPLQIVYDSPYILALFSKGKVEIRSVEPSIYIQTIQLSRASHISTGLPGTVYVASASDVWVLDSRPKMRTNVQRLVLDKQFELAVQLAEKCRDIGDSGVIEIKRKYAFNLFCQKKFDSWLDIHSEVKTDVMTVIAHFPQLLDSSYQESLKSLLDDQPPDLTENELKRGLNALARFLAEVRTEHAKAIQHHYRSLQSDSKDRLTDEELRTHENILQVVDTTLLKCYLAANESLVESLMRLPDNMCILADSEAILKEKHKYYELFLLYEKRKLHAKALLLLKDQASVKGSLLYGYGYMIQYLQKLGNMHIDFLFTYAPGILHEDIDLGLQIFTSDDGECRYLDRENVLNFLTRECVPAMIPYLEHIIYHWGEKRPKFHEVLGELYIAKAKNLLVDYIAALKDDENLPRAGEEDGELGEYRRKLIRFLRFSTDYSPEKLLVQLRHDSFYEERAILLGRLKRHEQALAIYTIILRDYKGAEEYCEEHYDPKDEDNSKVFLTLLKMYTHPPDPSILGIMQKALANAEPNQAEALKVLKKHANELPTVEAIKLLPDDYSLKSVWAALEAILQSTRDKRTSLEMRKAVCTAALAQCEQRLSVIQSVKVSIDNSSECSVCGKKISSTAFARHANGRLEHFHCYQRRNISDSQTSLK